MNDTNHQATTPLPKLRSTQPTAEDRLAGLKGKGPREVLNAVAPPRLNLALLQATVGTLALMAVLTVVPYLLGLGSTSDVKKPDVKQPEKKDTADNTKPDQKSPETKTSDKKTSTADSKKDQSKTTKDSVDKLKENDVKKDKPKDPFGTNIDELIDKK